MNVPENKPGRKTCFTCKKIQKVNAGSRTKMVLKKTRITKPLQQNSWCKSIHLMQSMKTSTPKFKPKKTKKRKVRIAMLESKSEPEGNSFVCALYVA